VGVGNGGNPEHMSRPSRTMKESETVPPLEPPQLIISAAARNDSTGTATKDLNRQLIKL
jgi:hypothetical protein